MMHENRVWCVSEVATAEELARQLTETTWCCCTGFQIGSYLFLNDSTSPDGTQEFAVVKRTDDDRLIQIESITFGWCSQSQALDYVRATIAGHYDHSEFAHAVTATIETPDQHGSCRHCA